MPSGTYVPLAQIITGGTVASVTFNNISPLYSSLLLWTNVRTASAGNSMELTFNGSTAANYSSVRIFNNAGTVTTARNINAASMQIPGGQNLTNTANTFSSSEILISGNYGVEDFVWKMVFATSMPEIAATSGGILTATTAGFWGLTNTITSITLTGGGGNFALNSSFYLYGLSPTG